MINGAQEYHWVRIAGVDARTGSPARARLEVSATLEQLLGGAGALGFICTRLNSAPSMDHFLSDLQEVLERLTYSGTAGPGPGSGTGAGRPGAGRGAPGSAAFPTGWRCASASSGGSSRVMQLLLRDLDLVGWGCLEELDQNAARLTLLHLDFRGREHRLRLVLPYDYPASPPTAATDLTPPFSFGWCTPAPAGGHGIGVGGLGGACSSLADVFEAFKQAVRQYQPLWSALDDLDRRARVLDPPPTVSAARRHVGAPARRVALGGAASLQLRLDPSDPAGPPPSGGVAFLGPPDVAAQLREAFFDRLHLWSRDRPPVDNLELLLGLRLPGPAGSRRRCRRQRDHAGMELDERGDDVGLGGENDDEEEGEEEQGDEEDQDSLLAECPICLMHLLPLGNPETDGGGSAGDGPEAGGYGEGAEGGADGEGPGLVPDVVCPTPACGLTFHTPCLAEWLRSVPDTRVSFNKLFGRCPFCSNPITVRA